MIVATLTCVMLYADEVGIRLNEQRYFVTVVLQLLATSEVKA